MDKQIEILLDDSDDEFGHKMTLRKAKDKGSKKTGGKNKIKGKVTETGEITIDVESEPSLRTTSLRSRSSSTTKSAKKDPITINEENVKTILSKVINKSDPSHSRPVRSASLRGKENEEKMKTAATGRITRKVHTLTNQGGGWG